MRKLLMVTAVASALIALAVPAAANASWNDAGTPIAANTTIELSGETSFSGGVECPLAASITLEPGSTGAIHTWTITNTNSCVVIGTLAALGCTGLVSHEATFAAGGWTIHTTSVQFILTEIEFHWVFEGTGLCEGGIPVTYEGELTATPNNTSAVSNVTLSGELESGLGPVEIQGNLGVNAPNTGTYGI